MKNYTLPLISLLILATGCQLASVPSLTPQPAATLALSSTPAPPLEPTATIFFPPLPGITPAPLEKISSVNGGYLSPLDDIHLTDPNNAFNEMYLQQMTISPDHAYVVLVLQKGGQDIPTNIVRVLNIATSEILSEAEAPAFLALNADGLHYAAYSDHAIGVYEVFGGKQVNSWPVQVPVENGLFFSQDGAILAVQDVTGGVEIWDLNQGVRASRFDPGDPIEQAVFSRDDDSLTLLKSSQVEVYDTRSGSIRAAYPQIGENGQFDVRIIALNPTGNLLAVAGLRNGQAELKLLDATSTGQEAGWSNHLSDSHCTDLKFSPDGKWLAFATSIIENHTVTDSKTYLFDTATASLKQTWEVEAGLAFSQDGQYFAGSMADGTLQIWDLETGTSLARLYGHTATDYDVQFSRDGTLLASSSSDSTIRLWGYPSASTVAARAGLHVTDQNSISINGFSANSVAGSIPSNWLAPGASPARYQVVLSYQAAADTICMYERFANVGVPGATPVPLGGPQVKKALVRVNLTVTVTDLANLKPVAEQVFYGKADPAWKDCPQVWEPTWGDNLNISKLEETEFADWLQTALAPLGFTP